MIWILMQAEVAAYIVAQAISLLRVLITSDGNTRRRSQQSSTRASVRELGKAPATAVAEEVIELVQLPSGKIVRADSEEGKAHEQSKEGRTSLDIAPNPGQSAVNRPKLPNPPRRMHAKKPRRLSLQSWRHDKQILQRKSTTKRTSCGQIWASPGEPGPCPLLTMAECS